MWDEVTGRLCSFMKGGQIIKLVSLTEYEAVAFALFMSTIVLITTDTTRRYLTN